MPIYLLTLSNKSTMSANDEEYIYLDTQSDSLIPAYIRDSKLVKLIIVITLCVFVYIMIIILPNLAPEGVQIPDIKMVKSSNTYLHPIIPEKVKGKQPDPDDPVEIIPNFKSLEYASTSLSSTVKKHLNKLSQYEEKHGGNLDSKRRAKRMILIGDVHGSLKQLKKLLTRVEYDNGKDDHVILLGDFTNKGPDSIEVINYAIEHNLDCILGNHELAMMKRYSQFHGVKPPTFINHETNDNSTLRMKEAYDLDELMKLAKKITPEHINFLSKCSPIKKLGPVPHYTNGKQNKHAKYQADGIAVHAGLVWSKGIHHQDIEEVTTMRNLLPPNWEIPTDDRKDKVGGVKSVAWTKIWNEKQLEIYEKDVDSLKDTDLTLGTKIFYGHDAKRGVVTKEFSNGLDSGCVYGKQLTAVIIWAQLSEVKGKEIVVYKQMHVDVNC